MLTIKNLNIAREKSFVFSKSIIQHYLIMHHKREFVLSRYLVKCGTSIGSHLEEATVAHTKNEYFACIKTAYKETKKTQYWLRLMSETNMLDSSDTDSLLKETDELLILIGDILNVLKSENKNKPIASSDSNNIEWLKNH